MPRGAHLEVVERLGDNALIGRWLRLERHTHCEDARTGESLLLEQGRFLCVLSPVRIDGTRVALGLSATCLVQDADLLGSIVIDGVPGADA